MNPKLEKLLCDLAGENGGELKFATGLPVRFCGCQDTESPIALINSDQPQSELIFTILHEIGHNYLHCKRQYRLPIPWFLNRPYENDFLGESAYKLRRALRRFCGQEWQADIWALFAYSLIGCPDDLKDFLNRHPKKITLMFFVIPALWKTRLIRRFHKLLHRSKINPTTS
jgi:hypothetical protein